MCAFAFSKTAQQIYIIICWKKIKWFQSHKVKLSKTQICPFWAFFWKMCTAVKLLNFATVDSFTMRVYKFTEHIRYLFCNEYGLSLHKIICLTAWRKSRKVKINIKIIALYIYKLPNLLFLAKELPFRFSNFSVFYF